MNNATYYLKLALLNIKRAPLPYLFTVLIMGIGLGTFFSNATLYYWMNRDPLPQKSHALFYPRFNSPPVQCDSCVEPPRVLSYQDIQKLSSSSIPTAQAAMYSTEAYLRVPSTGHSTPTAVSIRITQRDFFSLFDVPFLHGQPWSDNSARLEIIISKNTAMKFFGKTEVLGQQLQLDEHLFTIIGVLDNWSMLPRLYDVNNSQAARETEDVYIPFETAYDVDLRSNTQSTSYSANVNGRVFAEAGRSEAYHQAQFWVQLDTPQQQQAYRQFMDNLVQTEKEQGRHPRPNGNRLHNILDIVETFKAKNQQLDAFAIVAALFLLVCLFNACHLSLNRYMTNQYQLGLHRALGASRLQLQYQVLADVLVSSVLAFTLSLLIAFASMKLINILLPSTRLLTHWDGALLLGMAAIALLSGYLVTLYPALKASFAPLNQQLK